QVLALQVDELDPGKEGVDHLGLRDPSATSGAMQLGEQHIGGDEILTALLPGLERIDHGLRPGLVDQQLERGRGVDVDDHRSPRTAPRISWLLTPVARGSDLTSMRRAGRVRPLSRSASSGERVYGTRRATRRPLFVISSVSPASTRRRISAL